MLMCARLPEGVKRSLEYEKWTKPFPEYLFRAMREDGLDLCCTGTAFARGMKANHNPRESIIEHCANDCHTQGAWLSFSSDPGCLVKFCG